MTFWTSLKLSLKVSSRIVSEMGTLLCLVILAVGVLAVLGLVVGVTVLGAVIGELQHFLVAGVLPALMDLSNRKP